MGRRGADAAAAAGGLPIPDRFDTVRAYLRNQGKTRLIEMILDLSDRDPALLDRLEIAASAAVGDPGALGKRLAGALKRALHTGRFVEYAAAGGWAQGVLEVLDQLEPVIAAGHSALVLDLLDDFFPRAARALDDVDDSDGGGGEILNRAAELHLAACRAVRPDPNALARDLFHRETTDPYSTFHGASETYAELLGPKGRATYRALTEAAWEALPRRPGRDRRVAFLDADDLNRHALFCILDRLLAQDGDLDRRIAVRAADLTGAHDYLNIAQLCLEHGRAAAALRWAEEGAWLHEDHASERLLVFLAERYRDADRLTDAEATLWRGFERRPSAEFFAALCAVRAGKKARVALTDRAAALLETRLDRQKRDHRVTGGWLADLLIGILPARTVCPRRGRRQTATVVPTMSCESLPRPARAPCPNAPSVPTPP